MPHPADTPGLHPTASIHVRDVESANASLRSLYGPLRLEASDEGFAWRARVVDLGPLAIIQGVVETASPVRIEADIGAHMISLLTEHSAEVAAGGERAEVARGRGVGVCSPGRALVWRSPAGFRSNNVRLDPAFLAAQLAALTGEPVAEVPAFALQMRTDAGAGAHIERLLLFLSDEITRGEAIGHPVLIHNLCEAVVRSLLLGQPHQLMHLLGRPAPPAGRAAVQLVEAYAEANAGAPVHGNDLVALTGASLPAIDAAFRKHRSTTLAASLQGRRLKHARQTLLQSPEIAVSQVAYAAGFLRPEQFEAVYFEAFHETPTETRRRGRAALDAPPPRAEEQASVARTSLLTPREREVCALVARGRLNKQIAAELGISEGIVERHRGRAMKKLGISSAAELGRLWAALGR